MNIQVPARMTVDEYLVWALDRPVRYELVDGVVIQTSPERVRHAEVKVACFFALKTSIKRSGSVAFAMPDGMTVRISDRTAFEPDALIYGPPRLGGNDVEVNNVLVVVEVLSPGTSHNDTGKKLIGYFSVPTIQHYLIVDADQKTVVHHRRQSGDTIAIRDPERGRHSPRPTGHRYPDRRAFRDRLTNNCCSHQS